MLRTYRDIFRAPGAALFSPTAALARLPLSMTGLGIVLLIAQRSGSYGTAGTIAAVYVLTASIAGPLQGRMADRVGQAPVLWIAGATHAAGVVLTVVLVGSAAPLLLLAAALAGLGAPQAGNMVRARWAHVLSDRTSSNTPPDGASLNTPPDGASLNTPPDGTSLNTPPDGASLNTAFAFEAVLDEAVFVVGPVLVTFLTLQVADSSGLLVSAGVSTFASWALALQRGSEPPVSSVTGQPRAPIGLGLLVPLTLVGIGVGVLFGSTEVIIVAFTEEAGRDDLAGVVLAIWAIGSLLAGLVVGALPSVEPLRRLRRALLGLTILFVPLGQLDGVPLLTIGMLAAGLMVSPTLIAMTRLVQVGVPAPRFTEALSWTTTGLAGGVALGAAAVGQVIDARGASAGFLVPLVAVAIATAIAWTRVPSGPGPDRQHT